MILTQNKRVLININDDDDERPENKKELESKYTTHTTNSKTTNKRSYSKL